jgi:EAL domain-containing protein (putative c-di-GMP-specific phosphodiesterase class I)
MKQWEADGLPPMRLSVNISPRQLKQQNIYEFVTRILVETGVEPSMLQLELTESALMETADSTIRPLVELYEKGVQIALDDFGTGYSSLIYLRRFPITSLKVDGSFVGEIASDPGDAAITAGLIALGRSLGLRVVVEGVETPEQLEFLRSQQCDEVQGFLVSRPVTAEAFADLVRSGRATDIVLPAKSSSSKPRRA